MEYVYLSFSSEQIITVANRALKEAGLKVKIASFINCQNDNHILVKTTRGAQLVIKLGSFAYNTVFIRSISRIINKRSNYSILLNGQSGKNTETLVFLGESGNTYLQEKSLFERYLRSTSCNATDEWIADRLEHLYNNKNIAEYNYRSMEL